MPRELEERRRAGYLCATSKPEAALRDRMSWAMHLGLPEHTVAREFEIPREEVDRLPRKRVDIAVLEADLQPVLFVESKAMISPDPLDKPCHGLMKELVKDLDQIREIHPDVPALGVMVMVHIEDIEKIKAKKLLHVVKYFDKFAKHFDKSRRRRRVNESSVQAAIARASQYFEWNEFKVNDVTIELKPIWQIPVTLCAFIIHRAAA